MDSPHDHFRRVVAETGSRIAAIRSIRERFGLDLQQAKEVMLQAEGVASSRAEHQEQFAAALEEVMLEAESAASSLAEHEQQIATALEQIVRRDQLRFGHGR